MNENIEISKLLIKSKERNLTSNESTKIANYCNDKISYIDNLEAQVKEVYKDNKELFATNKDLEAQLKSKDELLMEAYESLIDDSEFEVKGKAYCRECGNYLNNHHDNCIVNKAQDYISKKEDME